MLKKDLNQLSEDKVNLEKEHEMQNTINFLTNNKYDLYYEVNSN